MMTALRISSVSFDDATNRFVGDVELPGPDGTSQNVQISVFGHARWPYERIVRAMIFAARLQMPRQG